MLSGVTCNTTESSHLEHPNLSQCPSIYITKKDKITLPTSRQPHNYPYRMDPSHLRVILLESNIGDQHGNSQEACQQHPQQIALG